ncbi:MAG: dephospho-CoA kinase [Actinobacteria bacterium]|nr:dephospho-CoA kinase [Actinomycetota bacterium]|tara:strand:+ start:7920 stop:8483 length:564 start_codon:yes stop_codon:yes gene_type:complete
MKTVIGITGRVGVGKTYLVDGALKINPTYDVIDLDKLGHHVLQKDNVIKLLTEKYGDNVINKDNEIDRSKLGDIVFNDAKQLKELNKISHPYIKELAEYKIKESAANVILIVGALIKEVGLLDKCDHIIVIVADNKKREALMGSKKRIERFQASDETYRSITNHLFLNDFIKDRIEKFSILVQNLVS